MDLPITIDNVMQLATSAFMAILFIQSGLDKLSNWKDEKAFYKKHFSKSILGRSVDLLMPVLTVSELAAGFLSGIGILVFLVSGNQQLACWGMLAANLSFLMLFFGQRVAKDYAGAATIVHYFIVGLIGLYFYWV